MSVGVVSVVVGGCRVVRRLLFFGSDPVFAGDFGVGSGRVFFAFGLMKNYVFESNEYFSLLI